MNSSGSTAATEPSKIILLKNPSIKPDEGASSG